MRPSVFVDSGAFIAFLDASDRLHPATAELFADPPARWCTSVLVVSECYGWFLHRLGEEAARTFRRLLRELPNLEVLPASDAHRAAVEHKLDALRGTKLTWVDASSLVWLAEHGIKTVWGSDRHLGFEGATVLPGPPD